MCGEWDYIIFKFMKEENQSLDEHLFQEPDKRSCRLSHLLSRYYQEQGHQQLGLGNETEQNRTFVASSSTFYEQKILTEPLEIILDAKDKLFIEHLEDRPQKPLQAIEQKIKNKDEYIQGELVVQSYRNHPQVQIASLSEKFGKNKNIQQCNVPDYVLRSSTNPLAQFIDLDQEQDKDIKHQKQEPLLESPKDELKFQKNGLTQEFDQESKSLIDSLKSAKLKENSEDQRIEQRNSQNAMAYKIPEQYSIQVFNQISSCKQRQDISNGQESCSQQKRTNLRNSILNSVECQKITDQEIKEYIVSLVPQIQESIAIYTRDELIETIKQVLQERKTKLQAKKVEDHLKTVNSNEKVNQTGKVDTQSLNQIEVIADDDDDVVQIIDQSQSQPKRCEIVKISDAKQSQDSYPQRYRLQRKRSQKLACLFGKNRDLTKQAFIANRILPKCQTFDEQDEHRIWEEVVHRTQPSQVQSTTFHEQKKPALVYFPAKTTTRDFSGAAGNIENQFQPIYGVQSQICQKSQSQPFSEQQKSQPSQYNKVFETVKRGRAGNLISKTIFFLKTKVVKKSILVSDPISDYQDSLFQSGPRKMVKTSNSTCKCECKDFQANDQAKQSNHIIMEQPELESREQFTEREQFLMRIIQKSIENSNWHSESSQEKRKILKSMIDQLQ